MTDVWVVTVLGDIAGDVTDIVGVFTTEALALAAVKDLRSGPATLDRFILDDEQIAGIE